jgi:tetrahydromethanopterin S-methyltransferase subunit H
MNAAATIKTASGTKATAAMEAATAANLETTTSATVETAATAAMKAGATATMKTTAAATMKAAATATVKTTATALARLGYVCEREPHDCASQDCSERQRDPFAAPRSHHIFLHLN